MKIVFQEWNNLYFYQVFDVVDFSNKLNFIQDIDYEIETNLGPTPLYQTKHYLHTYETSNKSYWKNFFDTSQSIVEIISQKKVDLIKSWANKITPESKYFLHTHTSNLSVVYYLSNSNPIYGTYFKHQDKEVIFLGIENSLLIFNGNIQHEIVFPPEKILNNSSRYSIAMDFNFSS